MSGTSLLRAVPSQPAGVGLDPAPAWVDNAWHIAEDCRRAFSSEAAPLTVGFEEELILLDPATLLPINAVEDALTRLEDERFTCELRSAQFEVLTRPCATVSDACRELRASRALAADRLAGFARIVAAGVHPSSTLPIDVTDRSRYRQIAADHPWGLREGHPSGFHVHIAISGPARALAVYNAARSFLPELAALAANSPFLGGRDTGLASSRLQLNEAFPRSGIPPAFATWNDYAEFVAWGTSGALFPDQSYFWWDMRLHPVHGTLEFRVADAQTRVEDAGAIAAVCQTLVAALAARFDAGEDLPVHDTHRIAENRWLALRDGLTGALVNLDSGVRVPTRHGIGALLASLEPFAELLGARDDLLAAWTLLSENGAERQRRIATQFGLDETVRTLADETELSDAADDPHHRLRAAGGAI